MSTITSIAGSDVVKDSRAVINTNFTNLNTDKVEGQSASVDSEIALFSGTGGKTIKRATSTGLLKATSGVIGTVTDSSGLAGLISDETGSGALVFGTSPTLTTPALTTPTIKSWDMWQPYTTVTPTTGTFDAPSYPIVFAGVDLSTTLYPGMRVKITQSTVKYFIITAVSFSTDTTVTLYGGTDYSLVASGTTAISAFSYSGAKAPAGFPLDPTKWTFTVISDTTERSQASPVQDTVYNLGSLSGAIPIGIWNVIGKASLYVAGGTNPRAQVSLSTANNSISDADFTRQVGIDGTGVDAGLSFNKVIVLTSKTTYYLVEKVTNTSATTLRIAGSFGSDAESTKVLAISAYL